MAKISMITPIFCDIPAKIDWLDEMIGSVVNQSVTDWEMILIDDKSPLSLGPVRMKYANDNRLRWLDNAQNEGPAKTRNTAVALAESDCILPIDSDDLLADNETLENMYSVWSADRSKIIYGNLWLYRQGDQGFERWRMVEIGAYSFERAMNLEGLIPVTAMHSIDCHQSAGGWKGGNLSHGLEDVEYWIAAGLRGFCGQKIDHTTLVYRRQNESRAYRMKHVNLTYGTMQQEIKSMHSDVYKGVFPMACCGKSESKRAVDPAVMSQQVKGQLVKHVTSLQGYDEKDLVWVAYRGPKQGSIGRILVRGPAHLPSEYHILGNGHVFQIHKLHQKMFEARQKMGYEMNQPDPTKKVEPEPELELISPVQLQPEVIEILKPQLSTLVRLDRIGGETREASVQSSEVVIKPEVQAGLHVSNLYLSENLTNILIRNDYTVEKLSETTPKQLAQIKGIGLKSGQSIIEKAQKLIKI